MSAVSAEEITAGENVATVYSKSNCINCERTKKLMEVLDAKYVVVNLEENPEAFNELRAMNFRSVPVVVTPEDRWAGFNEEKIREFASGKSLWED